MDSYTINKIYDDGRIEVTFSVDGKKQNLSGIPLHDTEALHEALTQYHSAYAGGLAIERGAEVHKDVTKMVGKKQSIEIEDEKK